MKEWHREAQRLYAECGSYSEVGRRLGYTTGAVWKACNPERAREIQAAENARPGRNAQKRRFENAHRAECVECGGDLGAGTARADGSRRGRVSGVCEDCGGRRRVAKISEMMRLRNEERLSNLEIAARVDAAVNTVAVELYRMRALGYEVAFAPYAEERGVDRRADLAMLPEMEILRRTLERHPVAS